MAVGFDKLDELLAVRRQQHARFFRQVGVKLRETCSLHCAALQSLDLTDVVLEVFYKGTHLLHTEWIRVVLPMFTEVPRLISARGLDIVDAERHQLVNVPESRWNLCA